LTARSPATKGKRKRLEGIDRCANAVGYPHS
jgi:hypothetical protein